MATKKMQMEIEKTLKKVQEGIEEFSVTWDKMQEAPEVLCFTVRPDAITVSLLGMLQFWLSVPASRTSSGGLISWIHGSLQRAGKGCARYRRLCFLRSGPSISLPHLRVMGPPIPV